MEPGSPGKSKRSHRAARSRVKTAGAKKAKAVKEKAETASSGEERIQLVPIAKIDIGHRYRKEIGDLEELAESIRDRACCSPSASPKISSWSLASGGSVFTATFLNRPTSLPVS